MGGEHQVELTRFGKGVLGPTVWARCFQVNLIGSEAALTLTAVNHWIAEVLYVPTSLPDARVHQNRSIEANDVIMQAGHLLPPEITDVILQLNSQRTVVVGPVEPSVDLTRLEDESTPLTQGDQFLQRYI